MRIYYLTAYSGCNNCRGAMSYLTPIASEENIKIDGLDFND